jgi:4'-phosphopantetheinyl transferase
MARGPGRERLPDGECHLWVVRVEEALAVDADRYLPWLAEDERDGLRRYHFERHRREHLATRVLARAALSRYTGVDPAAWVFGAGPFGKPHVTSPPGPVAFNLANTDDLVVCAVAAAGEVGVDAEPLDARGDPLELAAAAFSPEEIAAVRATPRADRRRLFIRLWTLKEAYLKARGLGLALPSTRFTVRPQGRLGAEISFDPAVNDDPARWQLASVEEIPGYQLAVALAPGERRIVVRRSPTLEVQSV